MNCVHCGKPLPQGRLKYGYTECVECSTVERVGCVDIVYHKTGNTIEILPADEASKMQKLSRRSSFGTLSGMKQSRGSSYSTSPAFVEKSQDFDSVKEMALDIKKSVGLERASNWIKRRFEEMKISKQEMDDILEALNSKKTTYQKTENPYRKYWYSKREYREPTEELDEEIKDAFLHWRM